MSLPRYLSSTPLYVFVQQECNTQQLCCLALANVWYNYLRTMAKLLEKNRAIDLRKHGISIKQIADTLGVSKSTVSVWCRDIRLSDKALCRLSNAGKERSTAALLAYSESKRELRQKKTSENQKCGKNSLGTLTKRDRYCIGLGLYWGEGYKQGNREFGFTNSDPAMMSFYITWLQQVFSVSKQDLILRVSINAQHTNRVTEVETYWSNKLDIPHSQFTKISLIKTTSKKVYADSSAHYGTLRIKVRLGSDYREQVLGAIAHLSS